jgi:membrane protease YdiL (CAAX protease family)
VFLLIAATGEELGWRGVALPALLRRRGPLPMSLLLGVLVAAWHVPYWVLQGVLQQFGPVYLLLDLAFVVALTYQLTWLFLRSGGSVLAAVAFHVSFNLVNVAVLPITDGTLPFAVLTVVECGLALLAGTRLRQRS